MTTAILLVTAHLQAVACGHEIWFVCNGTLVLVVSRREERLVSNRLLHGEVQESLERPLQE